jgi:hypothetical protein
MLLISSLRTQASFLTEEAGENMPPSRQTGESYGTGINVRE